VPAAALRVERDVDRDTRRPGGMRRLAARLTPQELTIMLIMDRRLAPRKHSIANIGVSEHTRCRVQPFSPRALIGLYYRNWGHRLNFLAT
jgi:hypothetical protein